MHAGVTLGSVQQVVLDRGGGRWALLREPTGLDEEGVGGRSTFEAIRLLDRLLCPEPGAAVQPGGAAALTLPERDFLLAAAWSMGWGPKISGSLSCSTCAKPFDFDFDIEALVDDVRSTSFDVSVEDGVYTLPGGCRFRLPTGEDERALARLELDAEAAEQELLRRCLLEGDSVLDGPAVVTAMERLGAGLDVDLSAACSECGHGHTLRFQMQDYVLGALTRDWAGLLDDVHRLALAYRWSLNEILSLPRARRRGLVALLDGEVIRHSRAVP